MLNYTGHPIVDVGAATISAFVHKPLRSITEADLDQVADFIAKQYVADPLKSFLNVAFPNSGFTNPALEKTPQKRSAYAERVLRAYKARQDEPTQSCVFTGRAATTAALSEKLPPGRAFRQHIPMPR